MEFFHGMKELGNAIRESFDNRIQFLGQNIVEAERTRENARRFINRTHRERRNMARELHADLKAFTHNLAESNRAMRNKFHREQREIHNELLAGHRAFCQMEKNLNSRRRHFNSEIRKAKQKASRQRH